MQKLKLFLIQLVPPVAALVLAFVVGGVFIYFVGKNPFDVYAELFSQTLGTSYGIGQVLFKATPLIFTGLAAAISFRAGLFNIGVEGQLLVGSFLTAVTGSTFSSLPAIILIPLSLLAGVVGGAVWGFIPGYLKARFGAHEVINTIMMNFIAAALVSYFVNNIFFVPATVHTPTIAAAAEIPRLEIYSAIFKDSPVNVSLFLALFTCFVVYYLLWRTRVGYELRTIGLSPTAAEYGKINVHKQTIIAMMISGGIAGLVGSNFVLGYKHYFELGFSDGLGFIGIAVALLGKNHPVGVILAALFFGILEYGGLTVNTMVPKEIVNILQAIVILFMIVLTMVLNKWMASYQVKAS